MEDHYCIHEKDWGSVTANIESICKSIADIQSHLFRSNARDVTESKDRIDNNKTAAAGVAAVDAKVGKLATHIYFQWIVLLAILGLMVTHLGWK